MHRLSRIAAAGVIALASAGAANADVFTLNYEAAGVQNTTASFTNVGVEDFTGRPSGTSFTTDFGSGGKISATYSGLQIEDANQYGGAGGTGQYATAASGSAYSLKFTTDAIAFPAGVNYFGFWLSALDAGNQVAFYKDNVLVGSLSPSDILAKIGTNPAYFGNPNAAFAGQDSSEAFVFINFYDTTGNFDEVRFSQATGGGYESDNHTIGYFTALGGVPEPTTWAMLAAGFGLVGSGLRRRRPTAVTA